VSASSPSFVDLSVRDVFDLVKYWLRTTLGLALIVGLPYLLWVYGLDSTPFGVAIDSWWLKGVILLTVLIFVARFLTQVLEWVAGVVVGLVVDLTLIAQRAAFGTRLIGVTLVWAGFFFLPRYPTFAFFFLVVILLPVAGVVQESNRLLNKKAGQSDWEKRLEAYQNLFERILSP